MKIELFDSEVRTIWKKAAGSTPADKMRFEIDLYKKLLNFFQVGNYCYYIFNIPMLELEYVSAEVQTFLGYLPSEFNMHMLLDKIHPEDRPYFLNFENKAAQFFAELPPEHLTQYKVRYDYRIRKENQEYVRILQQSMVIEADEHGGLVRTLTTHTDISHLKSEGVPVMSFIGLDGQPSFINIDVEQVFPAGKDFLSKREKQVLALLIEGVSSKKIGELLHISKQTVDKHRKNMITRNNLANTPELIGNAIKKGWI